MEMKFQVKDLAVTIGRADTCPTTTACDPPITPPPLDAAFQEAAVRLLTEALEELKKAEAVSPRGRGSAGG